MTLRKSIFIFLVLLIPGLILGQSVIKVPSRTAFADPADVNVGGLLGESIALAEKGRLTSLPDWDNGALIGSNTTGLFPGLSIGTPGATDTVKLVATSLFGCKTDSIRVIFHTVPSVTAHFTKSGAAGCGPLNIFFGNDSGPAPGALFFWNFGNGQSSTSVQPDSISFLPSPYHRDTTYIITLKAYNGCDTTIWKDSVKVYPDPKAAFTVSQILGCSPFTDTLINLSEGNNTSYLWDFGDGASLETADYSNFAHVWHTGVIDTFTIALTATNRCGSRTDSLDIVISPNAIRPGIQLNGNSLFGCAPFTANFINNSSGAAQITANFNDGSGAVIIPGDQPTISHQYLRAGVYSVNMRLTNFCTDTSISLTVNVFAPPVPAFSIDPNPVCTGSAVFATNLSRNGNSFHWDWGDNSSSNLDSGTHVYDKGGNYTVQLTAALVNNFGTVCQVTGQPLIVRVVDLIPAGIDTGVTRPCAPYNMTVMAKDAAGAGSINWTFYDATRPGGSFQAAGQTASYQYNRPGDYRVRLIVQNIAGCSDTAIHSFTVSATPKLVITPFGPVYTCNTDTTLTLSGGVSYDGTDPLAWSWTINGQVAGAGNPFNYRFQVPDDSIQPVNYVIKAIATSAAGCADTSLAGTLGIRPLPPPRWAYVDAVAGTLARTRRPHEAVEPVRRRARELIARRAALGPDAGPDDLYRAGVRLGLTQDEAVAALGGGPTDETGVLAAGRALARLTGGEG